jgi:hypothetical protein
VRSRPLPHGREDLHGIALIEVEWNKELQRLAHPSSASRAIAVAVKAFEADPRGNSVSGVLAK